LAMRSPTEKMATAVMTIKIPRETSELPECALLMADGSG
jgi:hypothetical protein